MKPFSRSVRIKLISFACKARLSFLFPTARKTSKIFVTEPACWITGAGSFWGNLRKLLNAIISCSRSRDYMRLFDHEASTGLVEESFIVQLFEQGACLFFEL